MLVVCAVIVQKVKEGKGDFGYNARTDKYESLHKAGVIDPTKVSRSALENAASIASMMLTTECVISDEQKMKHQCLLWVVECQVECRE